jgi:hypothetical protein
VGIAMIEGAGPMFRITWLMSARKSRLPPGDREGVVISIMCQHLASAPDLFADIREMRKWLWPLGIPDGPAVSGVWRRYRSWMDYNGPGFGSSDDGDDESDGDPWIFNTPTQIVDLRNGISYPRKI